MRRGIAVTASSLARAALTAAGLVIASVAGYGGSVAHSGNFHTVDAGRFYRSAQLGRDDLTEHIQANGIKSILNLRGAHPGQSWYEDELAVSRAARVAHFDYSLSASRTLTASELHDLVGVLRTAPKPILVHCKSGADRSGLVAALYRSALRQEPAAEAAEELSLWYGHFPYLWTSGTKAMDESLQLFLRDSVSRPRGVAPTAARSRIAGALGEVSEIGETLRDAVKRGDWKSAASAFHSMH
jgi:protein tyrosine phosphatase (PTP) superfamily phosphohydrolase (DUF442 family)